VIEFPPLQERPYYLPWLMTLTKMKGKKPGKEVINQAIEDRENIRIEFYLTFCREKPSRTE